ncbi:phenoloxidase-activating factor 2 [Drosophila biarmipes]|uniref:phenoloxidase-activating factor 2 n=1 Tax=Drosophila biarmipes TaxID=125945 RepID=UPI0021CC9A0E|nr:phenoloxidase-activating factor 2 [Drosophila biarmipes]
MSIYEIRSSVFMSVLGNPHIEPAMPQNWAKGTLIIGYIFSSVAGQHFGYDPVRFNGFPPMDYLHPDPNQLCGLSNPNGLEASMTIADDHTKLGQYPWVVALLSKGKFFGGGSLIAPGVVLTAAHLLENRLKADIVVRAGEYDMASHFEPLTSEERQVASIVRHKEFSYRLGENNIALLFLSTPFELKPHIRTICLPSQERPFREGRCLVSGWGKMAFEENNSNNYSNILKTVDLTLVTRAVCQDQLRRTRLGAGYELPVSLICAGGERGKDACLGDGGSALFCRMEQDPARFEQIGIVNWGIGCGQENLPATYTNVEMFIDWIYQHLAGYHLSSVPLAGHLPLHFRL